MNGKGRVKAGRRTGDEGKTYREFFLGLFLWLIAMGFGAYFLARISVV